MAGEDLIGVYNGDVCVGARQWNTSLCNGGICELPIMGYSSLVMMVGMTAGALAGGILADFFGDYRFAFVSIGILTGMGSLFFVFARKPSATFNQNLNRLTANLHWGLISPR